MNYIDKNFYQLTNYLKKLSYEDIFENIKFTFQHTSKDIQKFLENYFKKFNYWGTLDLSTNHYEELEKRAKSIYQHIDDYTWLYQHLKDYRSKKLLYAILSNYYRYDFQTLSECIENTYSDYFDLDILSCDENEIFVDLGTYTGDTIQNYMEVFQQQYKKIYCYEITTESINIAKKNLQQYPNIEYHQKAVGETEKTMYIMPNKESNSANEISEDGTIPIEVVSIDHDITEPITTIKMDIEGSEQQAIQGCKEHIQNDKPKLLISVYHHHEDIWKIPKIIEQIKPGYHFYLRYHGSILFPTEVTLTAIYPK